VVAASFLLVASGILFSLGCALLMFGEGFNHDPWRGSKNLGAAAGMFGSAFVLLILSF
jgi:hypothetical protein